MSGHGDSLARDFRVAVDGLRLKPRLDRLHGGDVDAWARSTGIEAGQMLDFSASITRWAHRLPRATPSSRAMVKSRVILRRMEKNSSKLWLNTMG